MQGENDGPFHAFSKDWATPGGGHAIGNGTEVAVTTKELCSLLRFCEYLLCHHWVRLPIACVE